MQDRSKRLPVPKDQLPDFAPVPRKTRHDGWTPERQRAFVGAQLGAESEELDFRPGGEHRWEGLGEGGNAAEIDRMVAEMAARKRLPSPHAGEGEPPSGGEGEGRHASGDAKAVRPEPAEGRSPPFDKPDPPAPDPLGPDDPRLDYRNWETGEYVAPRPERGRLRRGRAEK